MEVPKATLLVVFFFTEQIEFLLEDLVVGCFDGNIFDGGRVMEDGCSIGNKIE